MNEMFLQLGLRSAELKKQLDETNLRFAQAEDRTGRQIAYIAYADVIAEAERDGWKVEKGERGQLKFSHPRWGTAGTGGDVEPDPERLRLLLRMGRQSS
jgi:hypothetical protein